MGSLDPTAEEFRSQSPNRGVQLYFPYGELETMTFFCYGGVFPVPFPPTQFYAPPLSTSPTRSLLLSFVPSVTAVCQYTLKRELEALGDVRAVQMEQFRHGTVTVHFYDLRHAETAFTTIRWHHECFRNYHYAWQMPWGTLPSPARGILHSGVVWAEYTLPARDAVPEPQNQGTIVVFNLDSEVDSETLRETFDSFGPIKELRLVPSRKDQRLVDYFDTRDAAKALREMNGKEINGKQVSIEFSEERRSFQALTPTIPMTTFWPQLAPHNVEVAMASLNLDEQVQEGVEEGHSRKRKFFKKQSSCYYWRGRQAVKHEPRFLIKEDGMVESGCVDSRTTLMIKNIPNKYSQKLLMDKLDSHCRECNEKIDDGNDQLLSSYDFVYLPIDFNNKCNMGYGFVNMTSPEAALRLYKAFHLQPWEVFNSRKICEVTYARIQGLESLKEHFKKSKFPSEMEQNLPVMFSPARDGRQLTEALELVGQKYETMILPIRPYRDDMHALSDDPIAQPTFKDHASTSGSCQ
ncbi:Protein terminal ear1, partial [Mucuna pruriens]